MLEVFETVVHSRDSEVLHDNGCAGHAQGDEDGDSGRETIDQRYCQGSDQFAEQVDSAHLRVEFLKIALVVFGDDDDL